VLICSTLSMTVSLQRLSTSEQCLKNCCHLLQVRILFVGRHSYKVSKFFSDFILSFPLHKRSINYSCKVLIACHEKSTSSGLGMNGYAIFFHKMCVFPCIHYSYTQCTTLLETAGVQCVFSRDRQCVYAQQDHLFSHSYFPADFSWCVTVD
jgi:hypothetical protein